MGARAVVVMETTQAPCDIGWGRSGRKRELMKLETIGCGVVQWWCCTRSWGKVVGKNRRRRRIVLGKEEGERRVLKYAIRCPISNWLSKDRRGGLVVKG